MITNAQSNTRVDEIAAAPRRRGAAVSHGAARQRCVAFSHYENDCYAHSRDTRALLEQMAGDKPTTLACMHGSAWTGDGAGLLRALVARLGV